MSIVDVITNRPSISYPSDNLGKIYPRDQYPEFWREEYYEDYPDAIDGMIIDDDAIRDHHYERYIGQVTTTDVTDGQVLAVPDDWENEIVIEGLRFHNVQVVVAGTAIFRNCEFSGNIEVYGPPGFENGCYKIAVFDHCKVSGILTDWLETQDTDIHLYFLGSELEHLTLPADHYAIMAAEVDWEEALESEESPLIAGGSTVNVWAANGVNLSVENPNVE